MAEVETVKCPQCGKPVPWNADSPFKPFCSERCRILDLGDWLSERHAIPGEVPLSDQEPEER